MNEDRSFPTMIIPSGTEITVNEHGELAIRTPGNLVIQNSGTYSVIECGGGSLRIDPDVRVEAASVKAADTCYVAGSLTAWRVKAKKVVLEKGSQAFIMLRESETLDLDRQARLVGNFGSEKELYLLLGRFNDHLRHLPQTLAAGDPAPARNSGLFLDASARAAERPEQSDPPSAQEPVREEVSSDPDDLWSEPGDREPSTVYGQSAMGDAGPFAPDEDVSELPGSVRERADAEALLQIVAQRELQRPDLSGESREALDRVLQVLRSGSPESVEASIPGLLARLPNPSPELERLRNRLRLILKASSSGLTGD